MLEVSLLLEMLLGNVLKNFRKFDLNLFLSYSLCVSLCLCPCLCLSLSVSLLHSCLLTHSRSLFHSFLFFIISVGALPLYAPTMNTGQPETMNWMFWICEAKILLLRNKPLTNTQAKTSAQRLCTGHTFTLHLSHYGNVDVNEILMGALLTLIQCQLPLSL